MFRLPMMRPICAIVLCATALAGGCAAAGPTAQTAPGDSPAAAPAGSPLGSYLAGRLARSVGDTASAAQFYAAALAADPENAALRHRTFMMLLAEGDWERALVLAGQIDDSIPGAFMADMLLATDDARRGDLASARERLRGEDDSGAGALMRPLLLAWIGAGLNDDDAVEAALQSLAARPTLAAFRSFHTALIEDFRGNTEAASRAYEETRGSAASNASRVVLAYSSFIARQGRVAEAESLLDGHLEQFPGNPSIAAARAELAASGTIGPVVRSVTDGIAEAYYGAAGILAQDRTSDAARIYARLALFVRPDFDHGKILLAEVLEGDSRYADAIAAYETIGNGSPYHLDARLRIASNLNRMERVDDAMAELDKARQANSEDPSALITLADLLRGRERYAEAVEVYDEAVARVGALTERHWALLYARGIALERSKIWERAEADFLQALELKPEQPLVLNYLGYSWVEQGVNLERARAMIERAVEQRPNDGYIVDSLGWVLYRLGDYAGAVKQLERAVELRPEDPIINDHLGDAYWRVGRRLEARFQWRHALSLGPDEAAAPEIEAKLKSGLGPVGDGDRDG